MKRGEAALLLPNAVCGIVIIAIIFVKSGSDMAISFFGLAMMFLIMDYGFERLKQTRKEFGPYSPPPRIPEAERIRSITLFILNIVVFFIHWFRPYLSPEITVETMVLTILIYGGFPMVILKWDFGKLGTELARHQFIEGYPE